MSDLKPCPFCGGDAAIFFTETEPRCRTCRATSPDWNTRTERPDSARKLAEKVGKLDFANGDYFELKFGGDGDNGERLIELLQQAMEQEK